MKKIFLSLLLCCISIILANAQEDKLILTIKESLSKSQILNFIVKNEKGIEIAVSDLNQSRQNKVIIKNPNGIVISYDFVKCSHHYDQYKTIIKSNSEYTWEFDLNEFFHPKFPRRFQNDKGDYQIIWSFQEQESEPYIYKFQ